MRIFWRTLSDAAIGLALFLAFAVAIGNYQRVTDATNRLGDILSVSHSARSSLKFSFSDSPLIAAAVVATAVPVQQRGAVTGLRQPEPKYALFLLAGVFSVLMALNLAFVRHLRREYASPRRGVWGGGRCSVENP